MPTFVYIGSVLPDTTRISSSSVEAKFPAGVDYPDATVTVRIMSNRVIGSCSIECGLTDVACATLRNIVQDLASSICNSVAIVSGAWTVVSIDTCVNPDGTVRAHFSNSSASLKASFARYAVSAEDIVKINQHSEGYFLRLALDDINSGLMEAKFMRSHFYRSVEALRRSISPPVNNSDSSRSWEVFRDTLMISRETIDLFSNHAERHGDYSNAVPMSGEEVDRTLNAIASIVSSYIQWFKKNKMHSQASAA